MKHLFGSRSGPQSSVITTPSQQDEELDFLDFDGSAPECSRAVMKKQQRNQAKQELR
jgi:hypothetical protein